MWRLWRSWLQQLRWRQGRIWQRWLHRLRSHTRLRGKLSWNADRSARGIVASAARGACRTNFELGSIRLATPSANESVCTTAWLLEQFNDHHRAGFVAEFVRIRTAAAESLTTSATEKPTSIQVFSTTTEADLDWGVWLSGRKVELRQARIHEGSRLFFSRTRQNTAVISFSEPRSNLTEEHVPPKKS